MDDPQATTLNAAVVESPSPIELGDYRLSRPLRRDAAEASWLAHDKRLGRAAVVKLAPADAPPGSLVARRRDELLAGARRAATLRDAACAAVFEVGRAGSVAFIARAYTPGRCLQTALAQRTPLEVVKAVQLAADLANVLARFHRMGAAHGNLKASNVILAEARSPSDASQASSDFAPLVLVDFRDPGPGAMRGDIRAAGQLLHELLLYAGKPPHAAPLFDQELDRILRDALRATGDDDPGAMERFALDLRRWLERRTLASSERSLVAKWWRPIFFFGGGIALLGVAGMLFTMHVVMFLYVGMAQLGPLVQSSAEMAAIPLVSAMYLLAVAKRSIVRSRGRQTALAMSGTFLGAAREREHLASAAPSDSPTDIGFLPTVAPSGHGAKDALGAATASVSLGVLLREAPPSVRVRVDASTKRITIVRRRSGTTGIAIAGAALAIMLTAFFQASKAAVQASSGWAPPFAVAALPAVAYFSLALWLNRRWVANPVRFTTHMKKRAKASKRRGRWLFTRQRLALSPEGIMLDSPSAGAGKGAPWSEVWDVREGTRADGIEMATLAAPLYFGAGLADGDREWLARIVRLVRSDPVSAASIVRPRRKARLAPSSATRFACAAALAGLVVLLATIELIAGLYGPAMFAPENPWRPAEIVLNGTARLAVFCNAAFVTIGLMRLAKRRRSGAALVKIGFGMRLAWYAFVFVFVRYLHATGVFAANLVVTPAINASTAAVGLSMWLQIALVSSVFLFEERMGLQDD